MKLTRSRLTSQTLRVVLVEAKEEATLKDAEIAKLKKAFQLRNDGVSAQPHHFSGQSKSRPRREPIESRFTAGRQVGSGQCSTAECPLLGEQRKTFAQFEFFRF
jgi:hypothetical protein